MQRYHLLSVGSDSILLNSRNAVLERAGYVVTPAYSASEALRKLAEGDFDLVVVCHSIAWRERDRLIMLIKARHPLTPVLAVEPSEARPRLADAATNGLLGPEAMLRQVAILLDGQSSGLRPF